MKIKRTAFLFIVAVAVFALAVPVYAANRVEVKVTSEPIPQNSPCDKAGGFTLEFDPGTELRHGDKMYFDLDLGVTLCRDIDIVLSPIRGANLDGSVATSGWGGNVTAAPDGEVDDIPEPSTPAGQRIFTPVAYHEDNAGGAVPLQVIEGGVFFHIYGTTGQARVNIDVLGEDQDPAFGPGAGTDGDSNSALILGSDPGDKLIIYFFDQMTNPTATNPSTPPYDVVGNWIDPNNDNVYDVDAEIADNTLCINVSQFSELKGQANMDSRNDKFTFIPSNPQIFHVGTPEPIELVPCKGQVCGNIEIGTGGAQGQTGTCVAFDNESGAGYCGNHLDNRIILWNQSGQFDLTADYQVEVTIMVNGVQSSEGGVYFSNLPLVTEGFPTDTAACTNPANNAIVGADYFNAAGGAVTPAAPNAANCGVAVGARATRMLTPPNSLGLVAGDDYLYIDLPSFNYDAGLIEDGDYVEINLRLLKAPCGTLFSGDHCIGTFGCDTPTVTRQLFFPYFTRWDGTGAYWNGIAIDNLNDRAGEATVWVYEKDGDVGQAVINIDAMSMYTGLMSGLLGSMTLQDGTGELGDSPCYVVVCANFNADGFAFMAKANTGESMGYIPRINNGLPGAGHDSYTLCP